MKREAPICGLLRRGTLAGLAGLLGCFTGDGLAGQPCRTDADCNAVADALGRHIACHDGVCGAQCGDGVVIEGVEECDDGNDIDTDACVRCKKALCGDDAIWTGVEECDDGNEVNSDACVDCKFAVCGDGFTWAGREQCDDDSDACMDCRLAPCGDGVLNPASEACDDGNALENDGCNSLCEMGAELLSTLHAGASHACVVRHGALRCWGNNEYGQLGHGNTALVGDEASDLPHADVSLGAGARVVQVVTGFFATCVLLDAGEDNVRCWGGGILGIPQLGANIGDDPGEIPPPPVKVGGPASQLGAGIGHTCALLVGGEVRCWGIGGDGDLGYGDAEWIGDDEEPWTAGPVQLGRPAAQIAAGASHNCAVLDNGDVRCWGDNFHGQLGYGHTDIIGDDEIPQDAGPVKLGGRAVQVAAGGEFTCALLADGRVRCWGRNYGGELGLGHTSLIGDDESPADAPPVDLGPDAEALQIAAGRSHACALLRGGSVRCWGANEAGELGYGHREAIGDDEVPAAAGPVELGGAAVQIAAGEIFTCALLVGGSVRCWGLNDRGQLGLGHKRNIGDEPGEMPPEPLNLYEKP